MIFESVKLLKIKKKCFHIELYVEQKYYNDFNDITVGTLKPLRK